MATTQWSLIQLNINVHTNKKINTSNKLKTELNCITEMLNFERRSQTSKTKIFFGWDIRKKLLCILWYCTIRYSASLILSSLLENWATYLTGILDLHDHLPSLWDGYEVLVIHGLACYVGTELGVVTLCWWVAGVEQDVEAQWFERRQVTTPCWVIELESECRLVVVCQWHKHWLGFCEEKNLVSQSSHNEKILGYRNVCGDIHLNIKVSSLSN